MDAVVLFWILVVFYVIIDIISAVFLGEIAKMKGHDNVKYIVLCLVCGPAGWIMVAALPDRTEIEKPVDYKHNPVKKEKIEKVSNEMNEQENNEALNEFISNLEKNNK